MRYLLLLTFAAALLSCGDPESQRVELPKRETREPFTIVRLYGSPYEMGRQHGEILREELREGADFLEKDVTMQLFFTLAAAYDLYPIALDLSFPEMIDECQGMVDGVDDPRWGMEQCLLLNFGDVVVEIGMNGMPDPAPGCSQIVATGTATPDGRLYHARILDWYDNAYVLAHPVIFVRQPTVGIPHVFIGFPGNLSPYTGMNLDGLSVGSNEIEPPATRKYDLVGRSHVQVVAQLLARAGSLEEARELVLGYPHISWEAIVVTDGDEGVGEAYELSPAGTAVRTLTDGFLYEVNHFIGAATADLDIEPIPESSINRQARFEQLLPPAASESVHGTLDLDGLLRVVRDRVNPNTGLESPADTFDDNATLATNGALFSVLFDPERRHFWASSGTVPVPQQSHIGFSLLELLGREDPNPVMSELP